jgi:hypothetical protein
MLQSRGTPGICRIDEVLSQPSIELLDLQELQLQEVVTLRLPYRGDELLLQHRQALKFHVCVRFTEIE